MLAWGFLSNRREASALINQLSESPVLVGLSGVHGAHAVVAYDYDEHTRTLAIYDPNYPGVPRIITFSEDFSFEYASYSRLCALGYTDETILEAFVAQLDDFLWLMAECPVEVHVYDCEGKHVGRLANGTIEKEITASYLAGEDIVFVGIPEPKREPYSVVVVGTDNGTYNLSLHKDTSENDTFAAVGLPVTPVGVYEFTVNWSALAQGEDGTHIVIDADGDGIADCTTTADKDFTYAEYLEAIGEYAKEELAEGRLSKLAELIVRLKSFISKYFVLFVIVFILILAAILSGRRRG
jgi:hypothetical protein